MQLYFIRHAQSANNALYDNTGSEVGRHSDPGLSPLGNRQLAPLAALAAHGDPDAPGPGDDPANRRGFALTHIYSSLMERAILTASALAGAAGLRVAGWIDAHERGGIFEGDAASGRRGLPGPGRSELVRRFPDLLLPDDLADSGWWDRPFEPVAEMASRAERFLQILRERHGGTDDRIAVVSHAGFYQAVMRALLGLPPLLEAEERRPPTIWFRLANAGVSRIDLSEDATALIYLNRLDHLPAELIT